MNSKSTEQDKSLRESISAMAALHASKAALPSHLPLDAKWEGLLVSEPKKLFKDDGSIKFDALENFRRLQVFVSDLAPVTDFCGYDAGKWSGALAANPLKAVLDLARELVTGKKRGDRRLMREIVAMLEQEGAAGLLGKYPVKGTPGAPYCYSYKGWSFNLRWVRHIYFNNLLNKTLGAEIDSRSRFVNADIGCSYGTFCYMFKSEHPNTTQVLVDFPEQLILARYFLGSLFPDARFATLQDFVDRDSLDRDFLEQFDFVLVPVSLCHMLTGGSVDMVTNFFSFGEMRREWFMDYLESDFFKGAEFLFICNRFESSPRYEPTYDTDLTILDYPLADFEKLFFGVLPVDPYHVEQRYRVLYETVPCSSQYFDFIGRRKNGD
ncbi:MAG: putative sugar O-methyltransferase, partial [Alphaproteobacteria bacterium]|nr:putative sugar O-methyltransferase [Alphaproteobacteria bacterium]